MTSTNGDPRASEAEIAIAYSESTPPTTLLLIHGFPLSSRMWQPQLSALGDMARVIAPDLRGFGHSELGKEDVTISDYALDCLELLAQLGIDNRDGPVVVAGLSMGGYVALEVAREHADLIDGLILVSTRPGADDAEAKEGRSATAKRVRREGIDVVVGAMLPKLMAEVTYDDAPELVDEVEEIMRASSQAGVAAALEAMRDRRDATDALPEIGLPTMVVHGSADRVIKPSEAEAMAEAIPDAELVLLEGAGHLPNLERAEAFNAALASFLARWSE